jgi:cytoskeleton protein RodZ
VIVVLEFVVPVARRMMATRGDAPVVVAPVSAPRSEAQSPVQTAAAPAQSTPASETPANETIAATPIVEPAAAPSNPVPEPAPVASASEPVRLRIEFNEPSWAEVYDATGQRLLYDVGQPDRPRVVSGAAPLNVVVGIASAVKVQVNDQAIIVPRRANKDSTRFTVAVDGSVR